MKNTLFSQFVLTAASVVVSLALIEAKPVQAASFTNVNVGTFTGGDVGEGLDLDGNFVYAVNVRGPEVGLIRDANFTSDNASGVTINAQNQILNWHNSNYGNSINDNKLEQVMQSIRWSSAGTDVLKVNLKNIEIGSKYKAQLLFAESCCTRGFDVFAEGTKLLDNFSPYITQGGIINNTTKGAVISFEFTAMDDILNIAFGGNAPYSDNNPILNGLTLEKLDYKSQSVPEPGMIASLTLMGLLGLFTKRSFIGENLSNRKFSTLRD